MRSRYSAFVLNNYKYIISTTHHENQDFTEDTKKWKNDILDFCNSCEFRGLDILEFIDGTDESFITFKANIYCHHENNSFIEKSKFLKIDNMWLYHSGETRDIKSN